MKIFEASGRGAAAAAAAAYATFHTVAGTRAKIREIGFFLSAATATSVGIGTPANTPVANASSTSKQRDVNDLPAPTALLDTGWSTAPTAPTSFWRRAGLPATQGAGLIWTFSSDAPLVLAASSWLTFWNFGAAAGAAPDLYVVWDE